MIFTKSINYQSSPKNSPKTRRGMFQILMNNLHTRIYHDIAYIFIDKQLFTCTKQFKRGRPLTLSQKILLQHYLCLFLSWWLGPEL